MTIWRPVQTITVKVIGLAVHKQCLLAAEVYNDKGDIKGVRPLGGHIEFGETREIALRREFLEELDTEIEITGSWNMFENLYKHEGVIGHEYVQCVSIELLDLTLYTQERIVFCEDSGAECVARWFSINACKSGELTLFPTGLVDIL